MAETEPTPEYRVNIDPYEKLVLDLLDNVKVGWNGNGVKLWIMGRLGEIENGRFQQDGYGNMIDTKYEERVYRAFK